MATKHVKFLSLILALVMIFSLLPMSVLAEEAAPAQTAEQTQEAASAQSVAITGSNTYQGVTANVSAPAGAFPAGTKLTITPVGTWYDNVGAAVNKAIESVKGVINDLFNGKAPTDAQVQDTVKDIKDAINNVADTPVSDMVAFDITFTDASGAEVQPAAGFNVDVTFDVSASSKLGDAKDLSVFHMEKQTDGNTKPVEMDAKVSGDKLSVDADSFSIYVVGKHPVATYTFYNVAGQKLSSDNAVQIVKDGDTLYEPTAPVIDGKSFQGWYTAQTYGTKFTGFGVQSGISETKSVSLYARYADGYSVFFCDASGKVMHTEVAATGKTVNLSVGKFDVNSNQAITGWNTVKNGTGTDYAADADYTMGSSDITLYAVVENVNWVTFNSQGGSSVASEYALPGGTVAKPTAPTRSGYTFGGWYTEAACTNEFKFSTTITAATTLYAKWIPGTASYSVVYWIENANDTEYTYESQRIINNVATGSAIVLADDDNGYSTSNINSSYSAYFTYKDYDTGKTVAADGTTVVNVHFSRNSYTVSFDLHDDHYNSVTMTIGGKQYKGNTDEYSFTAKYDSNISALWPTAANFKNTDHFLGWSIPGETNTAVSKRLTMTSNLCNAYGLTVTAIYGTNCLDHLYYMFESLDQTSAANGNERIYYNGTYYDKSATYSQDANSNGGGWSQKQISGMTAAGVNTAVLSRDYNYNPTERNVFLYYTRNSYTLTFVNGTDQKDVSGIKFGADITGQNYNPTRPASVNAVYVFDGWYTTTERIQKFNWTNATMPASNTALYSKWVAPTVKVGFILNGGTPTIEDITANYGSTVSEPTAPTKTGYTFAGWCTDSACATPFSFTTPITADTTLYAKWLKNGEFTVTYDANGGNGTITDTNKYADGAMATVKSPAGIGAPENEIFLGWNTAVDGSGTMYQPGASVTIDGVSVTLYAIWGAKAPTTTLTYNANGGAGGTEGKVTVPLANNELVKLNGADTFTRAGYTLVGWNTMANGTGTAYSLGQNNVRVDDNGTNTLYAVWAKLSATPYRETYDGNAHSITVTSELPTGYTIQYSTDNATWNGTAPTWTDVTTAQTVYVKATNSNNVYAPLTATATVMITPVAIELTANSASKPYDGKALTDSGYKITSGAFVGEDGLASVTVTGSQTYVGTHANTITGHTLKDGTTAGNYTITYKPGTLTVTKVATEIVITANSDSKTYDGKALTNDGCTYTQDVLATGDVLTAVITGSQTDAGSSANVVTSYKVMCGTTDVTANYTFGKSIDGTLTVNPAAVTVTANDKSKTYGEKDPALDATVKGTLGTDTVAYNVTRAKGEDVGTYAITPAGDATQGNYAVTYVKGTFTIKAVPFVPGPDPDIKDPDVPKADLNTTDHYAYIIGMPDGLVHPEQNITRGEVATIFFRMLTDESRTANWKTTNSYKDVPATLWCNNAISTLSNAGIIKGYDDGTFRPNAPITRAEFATMAVRFFESKYNGNDKFSDIATSWARQYINAASEAGIIKGYTDGTFRPTKLITRAEAVTIMNRALLRAPDKDHLLADMKVWPDNQVLTKWYYADMQEATNSHDYTMPEDESVTYETWTKMQAVRDWAKFETEWATANASTNPGEVVTPVTPSTGTSGS